MNDIKKYILLCLFGFGYTAITPSFQLLDQNKEGLQIVLHSNALCLCKSDKTFDVDRIQRFPLIGPELQTKNFSNALDVIVGVETTDPIFEEQKSLGAEYYTSNLINDYLKKLLHFLSSYNDQKKLTKPSQQILEDLKKEYAELRKKDLKKEWQKHVDSKDPDLTELSINFAIDRAVKFGFYEDFKDASCWKKFYRQKAINCHPDKFSDPKIKKEMQEEIRDLNRINDILRKIYEKN